MKINVTQEEFVSVILIYLLDKINNRDNVFPFNEEIEKIIDKMKVIKPQLTKHYLNAFDSRIYYKRIRDAFKSQKFSGNYVINIVDKKTNEEIEKSEIDLLDESDILKDNYKEELLFYKIKEAVKTTIKKIKKRRFYKATPLSEEELERMIKKVIKEIN